MISSIRGYSSLSSKIVNSDDSIFLNGNANSTGFISFNSAALGTNNYTLEFWFKPTSLTTVQGIFGIGASTNDNGFSVLYDGVSHTITVSRYTATNNVISGGQIIPDSWNHVAIIRQYGVSLSIYINGVLSVTSVVSTKISQNVSNIYYCIGRRYAMAAGNPYIGYIDEMRLSTKVVYTGNFTVPATLDVSQNASTNTTSLISSEVKLLLKPDVTTIYKDFGNNNTALTIQPNVSYVP